MDAIDLLVTAPLVACAQHEVYVYPRDLGLFIILRHGATNCLAFYITNVAPRSQSANAALDKLDRQAGLH